MCSSFTRCVADPIRGVRCNSYTLGDVGGTCQWPLVNICVLLLLDVSLTRFGDSECVVIRILGDVGGTCQWPPVNICVLLLLDVSLTRFGTRSAL
jgi:hypothetical protein